MADDQSRSKDEALKNKLTGRLQQLELALATPSGSKTKSRRKKWSSMESLRANVQEPKRNYGESVTPSVPRVIDGYNYSSTLGRGYKTTAERDASSKELYNSETFLPDLLAKIRNNTLPLSATTYPTTAGLTLTTPRSHLEIIEPRGELRYEGDADFYIKLTPGQGHQVPVHQDKLSYRHQVPVPVHQDKLSYRMFDDRPEYHRHHVHPGSVSQENIQIPDWLMQRAGINQIDKDMFPTDAVALRWARQKLYDII